MCVCVFIQLGVRRWGGSSGVVRVEVMVSAWECVCMCIMRVDEIYNRIIDLQQTLKKLIFRRTTDSFYSSSKSRDFPFPMSVTVTVFCLSGFLFFRTIFICGLFPFQNASVQNFLNF